jgi:hypothetical protein
MARVGAEDKVVTRSPGDRGEQVPGTNGSSDGHPHKPAHGEPAAHRRIEAPGAWMSIPASWLERCRISVESQKLHQLLKLDPAEAEKLTHAATQAMDAAKQEQAGEFVGRIMKEGDTLHLPALSEEAIRLHVEEVVSTLPGNLSPAEKELAGFLMERRLKSEYGHELEVTLAFSGGCALSDLRHLPRHLLGFNYAVRQTGSQAGDSPMHYGVLDDGRLDFLKLDPSVNNQGRDPLDQ